MTVLLILSCVVLFTSPVLTLPPTEPPLIEGHPFIATWNIPTEKCRKFQIHLDTSAFQAVTTPNLVHGQFLTIFYEHRLGLYPKVDTTTHKTSSGGVPQQGNLKTHLAKAKSQIEKYISKDSSPGLVVIDWESWRPLWDRNWGSKRVYQKLSIAHTLQMDPYSSMSKISAEAKRQFQEAGRHFMEETITLGIRERPSWHWGYYLFPDCYNYNWNHTGYTGKCPADMQKQNNQLLWLWEQSTALFPSIYIHLHLRNSPKTTLFARNRVQEAVRVSKLPKCPYTVPIYVYLRPLYRDQNLVFLSETDLVSTIGESAALGASGIIMWGATKDYDNKGSCRALSEYLVSTMNPYIVNVTAAAIVCSEVLCQGNGRCLRKDYDSGHYLHLSPADFSIKKTDGKYEAAGLPSAADLRTWAEHFTCQCYRGSSCSPKLVHPKTTKHIWVKTLY
ncbi:hyaluronidase PH-20-like [Cheilinus undulatus]|uniref:hyaluronidase PH-20-like n=1 Tax=Cheilinus undulatus TaxID=241271 RepID=UPI001BD457A7|nr:hyaluronidase PH-20-like [Cheilinus undulatus]